MLHTLKGSAVDGNEGETFGTNVVESSSENGKLFQMCLLLGKKNEHKGIHVHSWENCLEMELPPPEPPPQITVSTLPLLEFEPVWESEIRGLEIASKLVDVAATFRKLIISSHEFTNLSGGKHGEWSTTASSDDIEKQEVSYEEQTHFFDTNEYFSEPISDFGSICVY
ncbi:hypothetical protein BUALT_Bualt13G0051100 [Buddleja alternifolia]|uniref:Uncharacterized protein n=1 Tax=Buddleja alternifolia TaxID=168488 RepID=A0AAV6WLX9_9LAMI|nr:hypothetical protein BUALT_Bualt13G0051100 [Buddleja alternifolia]